MRKIESYEKQEMAVPNKWGSKKFERAKKIRALRKKERLNKKKARKNGKS